MIRETRLASDGRRANVRGRSIGARIGRGPLAALIRMFRQDAGGQAAVEFGFIAPVLLFMLIGAVEITRAISIDRRFSDATSMVADLVAREQELTANDVTAIYDIVEQVMAPYDAAELRMSIIPVMSATDNANKTLVYPSTTNRPSYHGGPLPAKCQPYSLTSGLLQKNESVIVVEATYKFTPLFLGYVMGSMDWTQKAIAKPRKSLCVAFDGATCTSSCFPS